MFIILGLSRFGYKLQISNTNALVFIHSVWIFTLCKIQRKDKWASNAITQTFPLYFFFSFSKILITNVVELPFSIQLLQLKMKINIYFVNRAVPVSGVAPAKLPNVGYIHNIMKWASFGNNQWCNFLSEIIDMTYMIRPRRRKCNPGWANLKTK